MSWLKNIFKGEKNTDAPPVVENTKAKTEENRSNPEEDEKTRREELRKQVETINLTGPDDEIIEKIQSITMNYEAYYYNHGFYDGKNGARDFDITKDTVSFATLITDRVNSTLKGRINALYYHVTADKERSNTLSITAKDCRKNYDDIMFNRSNDYKQFSKWLAYCYIVFSFAMVLSDIAVSINLVGFFGIGIVHSAKEPFWKKYLDPDLALFSLGIAFCTVYVKVLYDEYIDSKTGYRQALHMRLEKENISLRSLKTEHIIKLIVKLLVLFGLIYLLYTLAKYRTYVTLYQPDLIRYFARMRNDGIDIKPVLLNCYIGITVMIPIISGVCLSIGLKIIGNRTLIKEIEKNKEDSTEELKRHTEIAGISMDRLERLTQYQNEWVNRSEKIKLLSNSFANKYDQGFRVAYRQAFGNDLYVLIEEYRNELMNKMFTKKITDIKY